MANPPIMPAPSPPSAPGVPQPVIVSGGQALPPSFPLGTAGTWLPPPQVGMGENTPFPTPVVPPGVMSPWPTEQPMLPAQPQFPTGSATAPAASAWFPAFTAPGPSPPIIVANIFMNGPGFPPSTPGTQPILIAEEPDEIPQLPWEPGEPPVTMPVVPPQTSSHVDPFEPMKHMTENTFDPGPATKPKPKRRKRK